MTLAPSTDFGIRGEPGKPYDVDPWCSVPGCANASVQTHHMWARSYLRGQPYEWVRLPDGTVIGNRTGMCLKHHNWVTGMVGGHQARIKFESGLFWWELPPDGSSPLKVWTRVGLLDPQPPGVIVDPKTVDRGSADEEVCPTCGHHKAKRAPAPRRKSKTWTVDVPDDAEVGAEILDEWVDAVALILGFDDERSRLKRYHALAVALAWIFQHQEQFAVDVVEATRA